MAKKSKKFERINILSPKYHWATNQTPWVWLDETPNYILSFQLQGIKRSSQICPSFATIYDVVNTFSFWPW